MIDDDLKIVETDLKPISYDNILFIGNNPFYGDVFKAYDYGINDECGFTIFFGTKGDEF